MCVRAVALRTVLDDGQSSSIELLRRQNHGQAYLLGLLALIKCSICSYTADTVYVDQRVYIICQTIFQGALACCSLLSPGRCCGGFALVLYAATLDGLQTFGTKLRAASRSIVKSVLMPQS